MQYLLVLYFCLAVGTAQAVVSFDGTETPIHPNEWRVLGNEVVPPPEQLAKTLEDHQWLPLGETSTPTDLGKVLLRLDLDVEYAGSQQPLLLIPYAFVPDMTVGLFRRGEVLMWESLEANLQLNRTRIRRTTGIIPLPVTEPGQYQVLVLASAVSNTIIARGTTLHLGQDYLLRDYPISVSIASASIGALTTYLIFCLAVMIYRFRPEVLYASVFLAGSFGVIALREGLVFLLWDLDVSWWIRHTLPTAMGVAHFGLLMFIREKLADTGWRYPLGVLSVCGWAVMVVGLLNIFFPVRDHLFIGLLGMVAVLVGFSVALIALLTRAVSGTAADRILALCAGAYFGVYLFRALYNLLVDNYSIPVAPLYAATSVVGAYIFVSYLVQIVREYVQEKSRETADLTRVDLVNRFSHELRTPLNAVIGLADLMKGAREPQMIDNYADMIQGAGHTLLGLVNDILDFSKLGSAGIPLSRQPIRLDRLMTEVLSGFLPQGLDNGVISVVDVDPDLPFFVLGDQLRLKQVFGNLVNNAIKFSSPGEVVTVHIACGYTDGDRVELLCRVTDEGRGIPQEKLGSIFEPYTQTEAEDGGHLRGTGLGLAICKLLIEQMGGSITVESELGKGSTFHFNLWLERDPQAPDLEQCFAAFKNRRVLVVAQLDAVRRMMPRFLRYWGAQVDVVADSGEVGDSDYDMVMVESLYRSAGEVVDWVNRQPVDTLVEVVQIREQPWLAQLTHPNAHVVQVPRPMLDILADFVEHLTGTGVTLTQGELAAKKSVDCRHKVLLVDDNTVNLTVAGKLLESIGVDYDACVNGGEALERLHSDSQYSLVLLDCEMPDISGFEVCRRWRRHEAEQQLPRLPIIALTAHALDEVEAECRICGMDDVVFKPVGRDDLVAVLNRFAPASGDCQSGV